jgi:two-component system invasion response regulator UvrY
MIKIFIADDHTVVREGLKLILAAAGDMSVSGEAADGQETLQKLKKNRPDLLLLDISMPIRNGVDILKQLHTKWPKLPILILTSQPEQKYAIRALKLGASGYFTKEGEPKELLKAIHTILSGKRYVSSSLTQQLIVSLGDDSGKPLHDKLSNRELEVLCAIARGKSLTEIANELFLSVKTVSTYRTRILEKLRLQSNADLIRYAIQHTLIEA